MGMKHLKYLKYLFLHKWYVMLECWKRRLFWRGIIHDWSKFLPSEWFPYTRSFYGDYPKASEIYKQLPSYTGLTKEKVRSDFDYAWCHHQHWNKHHWQYWILVQDEDKKKVLPIPKKYLIEMVCDWIGAGKAQGKPDIIAWYEENKNKMVLEDNTRKEIEQVLIQD